MVWWVLEWVLEMGCVKVIGVFNFNVGVVVDLIVFN